MSSANRAHLGLVVCWGILVAVLWPYRSQESPFFEAWAQAVNTLKFGVQPAENAFKAAHRIDRRGRGVGEFGLLSELADPPVAPDRERGDQGLISGIPRDHRFQYVVYLPSGTGGSATERGGAETAALCEGHWVAYAWAVAPEIDRMVYAIDQSGAVYRRRGDGTLPAWNALYGEGGWTGKVRSEWMPMRHVQ